MIQSYLIFQCVVFLWAVYKRVFHLFYLAFMGFSKHGNSDNNSALVNFLILGFIVFP